VGEGSEGELGREPIALAGSRTKSGSRSGSTLGVTAGTWKNGRASVWDFDKPYRHRQIARTADQIGISLGVALRIGARAAGRRLQPDGDLMFDRRLALVRPSTAHPMLVVMYNTAPTTTTGSPRSAWPSYARQRRSSAAHRHWTCRSRAHFATLGALDGWYAEAADHKPSAVARRAERAIRRCSGGSPR